MTMEKINQDFYFDSRISLRNIRADTWVPYDSMDTQDLRYR